MIAFYPNLTEFSVLAKKHNLVSVYGEILADLETPVSTFLKLGDKPYSFLLESVEGGETVARYSILGGNPSLILKTEGKSAFVTCGSKKTSYTIAKDPLSEIETILSHYKQAPIAGLPPFCGGIVGYMGYDTVRFFENIPDKNKKNLDVPESLFMLVNELLIFDHTSKKIKFVENVILDKKTNPAKAYQAAIGKIKKRISHLKNASISSSPSQPHKEKAPTIESNFDKKDFIKAILKSKEHIKAGDVFQLVLSQAFSMKITSRPLDIYRMLRSVNPSPYMYYFNCGDFHVVGASPEMHVRCVDSKAELRPIAGTRKRGKDEAEDDALQAELLADPKERAEHLMLVDLGRNDLGRVCRYNSVHVPKFMTVEKYSHVMHLVSHVEGKLRPGKTPYDLIRATFPAGTISGAPKIRAMEIIDNLENQKRGFYSGIVGYFSYSGNMDSCIAIRTIIVKDSIAQVQAGAGIVTDSIPENEYQETVNKAKALFKAVELAEQGVGL